MLARPLTVLTITGGEGSVFDAVTREIALLSAEDDGLGAVVVGVPRRLDGSADEETARVERIVGSLRARTTMPVHEEGERLASREAESRLAIREPDWRKRKAQLDA